MHCGISCIGITLHTHEQSKADHIKPRIWAGAPRCPLSPESHQKSAREGCLFSGAAARVRRMQCRTAHPQAASRARRTHHATLGATRKHRGGTATQRNRKDEPRATNHNTCGQKRKTAFRIVAGKDARCTLCTGDGSRVHQRKCKRAKESSRFSSTRTHIGRTAVP